MKSALPHAPVAPDNDFFNLLKADYQERSLRKGLNAGIILPRDAELIRSFTEEMLSSRNLSRKRANKLTYTLVGWRRFIGQFDKNDMAAIYAGIAALKNGWSIRGRPFKQNTISDHILIIKQFYLWLIANEFVSIPEKKIRSLKVPTHDTMTKVAADLLTTDEITEIIKTCTTSRDRAIVMMLYEGGFRIGEIGSMKWGDLRFDDHGIVVNVNFKTRRPRYIRLVMAREFLIKWKSDYPFRPIAPAMPVFVTEHNTPLTHSSVGMQLKRLAQRAGVEKHITPHVFRHSRITHLINEGVSESVIKLMMWGSLTTNMFQTYAHLTGGDIDREILRTYGITIDKGKGKETNKRLKPRQCPNCYNINSPVANYCEICATELSEEAVATDSQITSSVLKSPEALQAFVNKLVDEKLKERATEN